MKMFAEMLINERDLRSIYVLDIQTKTLHSLRKAGICTFQDLIDTPVSELKSFRGIGDKGKRSIIRAARKFDLKLDYETQPHRFSGWIG